MIMYSIGKITDRIRPNLISALLLLVVAASCSITPTTAVGQNSAEASAQNNLIGIVFAQRALNLAAEIEGQVDTILVELGDRVNRDQVLARLDSPWVRHDLEMARANISSAQAELDKAILEWDLATERRERRLQVPDSWSLEERAEVRFEADLAKVQVSLARAKLAADKAKVDQLADHLSRAVILAPFDGVISARYSEPGERVNEGDPLLRLITDNDLGIRFGIPEHLFTRIVAGSRLEVYFPVLDFTAPLIISRLAPEIDLATGLATAEGLISIPQPMQPKILAGMTVRVLVEGISSP